MRRKPYKKAKKKKGEKEFYAALAKMYQTNKKGEEDENKTKESKKTNSG
jgi:hypothetical protein